MLFSLFSRVFGWQIAKIAASEASPAVAWGRERAVEPGDMPLMPPRRLSNSIPWCIFPEASPQYCSHGRLHREMRSFSPQYFFSFPLNSTCLLRRPVNADNGHLFLARDERNRGKVYSNAKITINYNSNFYSVKIPIVLSHLHNTELNDWMVLDIFYSKTVSIKSIKLFKGPDILVYEFQLGRVKLGSTREQIQLVVRAGLEIGASRL